MDSGNTSQRERAAAFQSRLFLLLLNIVSRRRQPGFQPPMRHARQGAAAWRSSSRPNSESISS